MLICIFIYIYILKSPNSSLVRILAVTEQQPNFFYCSPKFQFVILIHVKMVAHASEMKMTLTATAPKGSEDVSAVLVNNSFYCLSSYIVIIIIYLLTE